MIILQLSDPHTEERGCLAYRVADTSAMIYEAVRAIETLKQKPDMVIITGDLASEAKAEGYIIFRDALSRLDIPVWVIPGNHDDRKILKQYLSPWCPANSATGPALCYQIPSHEACILCVDTSHPGCHHGFFTRAEAEWLEQCLAENRGRLPVIIFMHHFPVHTGIKYMDEDFEDLELFASIMRRNPGSCICCGHMHRGFCTIWEGCMLVSCPSSAMQMEIDISAEGGDAFFMEAPGYALHIVRNGQVTTFFGQIPSHPTFSGPHAFLGLNFSDSK